MEFEAVIGQYLHALLPVFFQMAVAEGLFVFGLKRRKYFWLRLTAGLIICLAAIFLIAVLLALAPHFLLGALLYFLMFALTLLVLWQCFDEKFGTLLFCGVAAYSAQNMCYRLYCVAELSGLMWQIAKGIGWDAAYYIVSNTIMVLEYAAIYMLFARRMKKYSLARLHNKNILLISAVTLVVTILLCSWTNVYYYQHFPLLIIISLFSVLCCMFILCLQSGMLENLALKHDIEVIEQMWKNDKRQYEIAKENMDVINVKCHDLKHKIKELRLSDGEVSKDELLEIENAVGIYDAKANTGCDALDVILTEKSLQCRKNGIKLSCMADGKYLNFMPPSELYSLFGNMLSNAIEAVQKVDDIERRIIAFTVRRLGDMLVIQIENYFSGEIVFKDGLPQTVKKDRINHGYGVKSMRMLTAKYGGDMSVDTDCDVYRLKIILPLP